jgi:hypothetical protein
MYLTPRKAEVDAVVAILIGDSEDEYTMAKDIIKAVAQVLSERDTIGVRVGFWDGSAGLAIGPFYDKRDAEKCAKDARESGLYGITGRLSGTTSIKTAETLGGVFCECGHRKELHPKSDRCKVLPTCDCKGFTNAT